MDLTDVEVLASAAVRVLFTVRDEPAAYDHALDPGSRRKHPGRSGS